MHFVFTDLTPESLRPKPKKETGWRPHPARKRGQSHREAWEAAARGHDENACWHDGRGEHQWAEESRRDAATCRAYAAACPAR